MTIYPTRQVRSSEINNEDKALLGGFETLTLFDPNLSDIAKELLINKYEPSMKSEDGKLLQYDNGEGLIADIFNDDILFSQLTDADIRILKLIDKNYQNFEFRVL